MFREVLQELLHINSWESVHVGVRPRSASQFCVRWLIKSYYAEAPITIGELIPDVLNVGGPQHPDIRQRGFLV